MIWANFLHIYQPPTQKEHWVKKIANESYRKLLKGFKKNPKVKVTLNINAVLTELFDKYNCRDVIVDWYYQNQLLASHVEMSSNYFVASLKSPEGGFERGDYEIVIFIDGNASLIKIPFLVV